MTLVAFSTLGLGSTVECATTSGTGFDATYNTAADLRTGHYACLRCNPVGSALGFARYGVPGANGVTTSFNLATAFHQIYIKPKKFPASGSEEICAFRTTGGATKAYLRATSAGKLQFYASDGVTQIGSDGTTVLTIGGGSHQGYYRLGIKVPSSATAAIVVQLEGVTEISGTGNTGVTANGFIQFGKTNDRNSQDIDFLYADWAVDDTDYPPDMTSGMLFATSNGSTMDWTAGTNASDFSEVTVFPPGLARYVQSVTNADVALFGLGNTATLGLTGPRGVKVCTVVKEVTSGTSGYKVRTKSGSTTQDTTAADVGSTSIALRSQILVTDPATGIAWTTSGIDALEVGGLEDGTGTVRLRMTFAAIMVMADAVTGGPPAPPPIQGDWTDTTTTGTHTVTYMDSTILGGQISMIVALPPNYDTETASYPVVYWCHGGSQNQTTGIQIYDQRIYPLIQAGTLPPMIWVGLNDGNVGSNYGCWQDYEDGTHPWHTILIDEIIPYIDANFRTLATAAYRGIEGFSVGARATSTVGFLRPDIFGVISILAAPAYDYAFFRDVLGIGPGILSRDFSNDEAFFTQYRPITLAVQNAAALQIDHRIRLLVGNLDDSPPVASSGVYTRPAMDDLHNGTGLHDETPNLTSLQIPHDYELVTGAGHNQGQIYSFGTNVAQWWGTVFPSTTSTDTDTGGVDDMLLVRSGSTGGGLVTHNRIPKLGVAPVGDLIAFEDSNISDDGNTVTITGNLVVTGSTTGSTSGKYSTTFTSQTTVTVLGATHGIGSANLIVMVYDSSSPANMIQPGSITVDPATFDVVVVFGQSQSGTIVII